jgi:hypothetical protein
MTRKYAKKLTNLWHYLCSAEKTLCRGGEEVNEREIMEES